MSCSCNHELCLLCGGVIEGPAGKIDVCRMPGLVVQRTYEREECLFMQGQRVDWIYLVRQGAIKCTTTLPDGREQIVMLCEAECTLALEALLRPRYPYTAQALTTVVLCRIRARDMMVTMEHSPTVWRRALELLGDEVNSSHTQISDLAGKSAIERVASFLVRLHRHADSRAGSVLQPLSRQEISTLLGLNIATVSRCITRLQQEGVVACPKGSLKVIDPHRLRVIAGEECT